MKLGIMQPYFLPYIGYFQLMNAVDEFVIYDNIQYTKKGWINRNRILVNGKASYITLPIKKDSDHLNIVERRLADDGKERIKLIRRIDNLYHKAPKFKSVFPLIEAIILFNTNNLFGFLLHSLYQTKFYLGILTPLVISSTITIDHSLKSEEKVISICRSREAKIYINAIGGTSLYKKENFEKERIALRFIKSDHIEYKQFDNPFMPALSIIDVMMFNPREKIAEYLSKYTLIGADNE